MTTMPYEPYAYRRVCDICGVLKISTELHRKLSWTFCSTCDAPGDRIQEEEDAAIARQEPFRILPVPNAKPLTFDSPYDWQSEEAQIFDFITAVAPARTFAGGASDVLAAAWAATYMADIIIEGTRPTVWLTSARTVLDRCLAYLLTQQYGSPTGTAGTADNPRYGGFLETTIYQTSRTIQGGVAFVKGYLATGTVDYLSGARRCATFIRHAQCGDLQTTAYTVFPSGGPAYHVGGLSSQVVNATGLMSGQYNLGDVSALWFLQDLADVVSASTTFGDSAPTAFFSAATSASLTTMIAELTAFAVTGAKDSSANGAYVSGLSTTAPKDAYGAYLNGVGGAGSWTAISTIASSVVTSAIKGLYESGGMTASVTQMLNWLAAFTANTANATPSTNTPQQTLNGITGTYDPAISPAVSLQASAPFTEATGTLYNLFSLGLLASALAATSPSILRASRSTLSPGQTYSTFEVGFKYLGPLGRAGLSLQPKSSATASNPDVVFASSFGDVYRRLNP